MNLKTAIYCAVVIPFLIACGKLEGEFSIKKDGDEAYKKIIRGLELAPGEKINWIFRFRRVVGRNKIGVLVLKKEVVWVDIKKWIDYVNWEKEIVYGVIENLPPGKYRIDITDIEENNRAIANLVFMIYPDEKEEQ